MHKSSYLKMQYFKNTYLNPNTELNILDIGSFDKTGSYNYGMILNEDKWTYTGLDLRKGNNVDIVVENSYEWSEIEDESYDVVVSGQAFEHIEFFWLTLEEIKRVLKPDGFFFLIVPSTGPVHKNPHDCYRFNENSMKSMAKYVDFRVIEYGTNHDEISHPWYDTFMAARKSDTARVDSLNERMDDIEKKLDFILSEITK